MAKKRSKKAEEAVSVEDADSFDLQAVVKKYDKQIRAMYGGGGGRKKTSTRKTRTRKKAGGK